MKRIYVVTHPESIHHIEDKVGGWYDTGLTEHGRAQAAKVARKLQTLLALSEPHITSSDLQRTQETSAIIAETLGCTFETDSRFREISYGRAEGESQAWLDARILPAPEDNRLDHVSVEGGESKRSFIERVYRAMDKVLQHPNADQIIVTHGYALTFVIGRWIELPLENAGWVNFSAAAGSITELYQDDKWLNRGVRQLSDTTHL